MFKYISAILLLLCGMFTYQELHSAIKGNISYIGSYDDNGYRLNTYKALNSNTTLLGIKYNPDSTNLNLLYSGGLSYIPQADKMFVYDNEIAAGYSIFYDEELESSVQFSTGANSHINTGELEIYNNFSYSILANVNHSLSESSVLRAGYGYSGMKYYQYNTLSYGEHLLFAGYRAFFETNTSINLESEYSSKAYSGKGSGMNKQTTQALGRIYLNAKITQSLAELTGLALNISKSFNITSGYQYLLDFNPDIIFEKEVYDDPFSFESIDANLTLTRIFEGEYKGKIFTSFSSKTYEYTTNFDNSTDYPNRSDKSYGIGFSLEKKFGDLNVSMIYNYNKNVSNSEYFNYSSNSFGIGFKYGF